MHDFRVPRGVRPARGFWLSPMPWALGPHLYRDILLLCCAVCAVLCCAGWDGVQAMREAIYSLSGFVYRSRWQISCGWGPGVPAIGPALRDNRAEYIQINIFSQKCEKSDMTLYGLWGGPHWGKTLLHTQLCFCPPDKAILRFSYFWQFW